MGLGFRALGRGRWLLGVGSWALGVGVPASPFLRVFRLRVSDLAFRIFPFPLRVLASRPLALFLPAASFFLALWLVLPVRGAGTVSELGVTVIDSLGGSGQRYRRMARSAIFLDENEPYDAERLAASLKALKGLRRFETIEVDSMRQGDDIALEFRVVPYPLIENIRVHNAYPLFESDVINAMSVYVGDVFVSEELSKQKKLVADLFRREGMVEPRVVVKSHESGLSGHRIISVRVRGNSFWRLRGIAIEGNRHISDVRLKAGMTVWRDRLLPGPAGRFVVHKVSGDLEEIVSLYRLRGYAEAEVEHEVSYDTTDHRAELTITVDEGPEYEISFDGNEQFGALRLGGTTMFRSEGNVGGRGMRTSVRAIEERYHRGGFPSASVTVSDSVDTVDGDPVKYIRFVIDEGPRTRVDKVKIDGNRTIGRDEIMQHMLTHPRGLFERGFFRSRVLREDLVALQALYVGRGFLGVRLREEREFSSDSTRVTVRIVIEEGTQTRVGTVRVAGTELPERSRRGAVSLQEGKPYRPHLVREDRDALSVLMAERGHPHVKVQAERTYREDSSKVDVAYRIDTGPKVLVGRFYYQGNFRTRRGVLTRELGLSTGEPFSLSKVLEGQRNLRNMQCLKTVSLQTVGLEHRADTVHLFVDVAERKSYYLRLGGGYETDEGAFAKLRVGDRNLLGFNRHAWVGAESNRVDRWFPELVNGSYERLGLRGWAGIQEPRLFGTDFSADLNLTGEREIRRGKGLGWNGFRISLGTNRKWTQSLVTRFGLEYEWRDPFHFAVGDTEEPDTVSVDDAPRNFITTTPSVVYDTRDSFIRPRKGVYGVVKTDVSKGLSGSSDDFIRYKSEGRFYFTPAKKLTLAGVGRLWQLVPFGGQQSLPEDQLFSLGGTTTIRGFSEDRLFVNADGSGLSRRTALSGTLELRLGVGGNFELAGFVDVGYLAKSLANLSADNMRGSVGLGVRYHTIVGPVGVMYGVKLDRRPEETAWFDLDRKERESAGRFHFSLGYTF